MSLMSRYNVDGEFIRCWNTSAFGKDVSGWSIIDCMMNIPLLYWASDVIGDTRFKKVAMRHADMTLNDHVREDGSVNHVVIHDTDKPNNVLGVNKGQGYSEDSCWSRGASWALYGFMLSYIHTKKEDYLKTAKKVADYFIKETEKTGWLPLLDFRQPPTPLFYDSTAGAIASCGLIELAKAVTDPAEQEKYLSASLNIMQAMEKNWCDWTDKEDSVLQMGSMMYDCEIHINIIYGDYFFGEAMLKLKGTDFLAW
jgi:unsaturated chondroitin disaccharide hydrolase